MMEGRREELENGKIGKVNIGGRDKSTSAQVMKVWERYPYWIRMTISYQHEATDNIEQVTPHTWRSEEHTSELQSR